MFDSIHAYFGVKDLKRRDIVVIVLSVISIAGLIIMPTGFEVTDAKTFRAKGVVLAVDNSDIQEIGMIRKGAQVVTCRILEGRYRGETCEAVNYLQGMLSFDVLYKQGEKAFLELEGDDTTIEGARLVEHYRLGVELVLFLVFALLLVGFAGVTGVRALLSFVVTGLMIWKVLLPGFIRGYPAIPFSLAVVTLLSLIIIFLVAGATKKGVVAFLGVFAGIILTSGIAVLFGRLFRIHGAVMPFAEMILYTPGSYRFTLSDIFLSGVFIASSGALMDIGMDIAASMEEVVKQNPRISRKALIFSGFSVGRAVIGTMTTTLLLAYSGGYTTMLMLFIMKGMPVVTILNLTYVASEILHTLVGSFGLIAVAPLTALIGGVIFTSKPAVDHE